MDKIATQKILEGKNCVRGASAWPRATGPARRDMRMGRPAPLQADIFQPVPRRLLTGGYAGADPSRGWLTVCPITGRIDDALGCLGTSPCARPRSKATLVAHEAVAEARCGQVYPHSIKGEGIYADVALRSIMQVENARAGRLIGALRTGRSCDPPSAPSQRLT